MFFLLRMAFWLSLAFLLLPSGARQTAAISGAKPAHRVARIAPSHAKPARAHASQDTLTAADLTPAWRGPRGDTRKKNGA
ncbi:MAG TPA: hypothetical protein VLX44_04195 [Xanthobacteraceae bacterium]|nr:hypothetical protein [Xanthobacteraceae bacterium]